MFILFGGLLAGAVWKRQAIYQRFPVVESVVGSVSEVVSKAVGRGGRYGRYDTLDTSAPGLGVDYLNSAPMREYS